VVSDESLIIEDSPEEPNSPVEATPPSPPAPTVKERFPEREMRDV
jgi:hypothetical protein